MEATIASIIFSASPLVYAAVGETIAEKAGVVNLSMEGTIMLSAMTAFVAALLSHQLFVGFLAAMVVVKTSVEVWFARMPSLLSLIHI